jgi:hypothetical protein
MLEELQSLSETKKKQVIVIATIIIMAIIIGVWVAYFNSTIMGSAQQQAAAQATTTAPVAVAAPTPTPAPANGPGLWQNIENAFGSIANIFRKPSQYNIQPQSN